MEISLLSQDWKICLTLPLVILVFLIYQSKSPVRRKSESLRGYQSSAFDYSGLASGVGPFLDVLRASRAGTYLTREKKLHQLHGFTFSSRHFGSTVINTIEPENIKAVLFTHFEDYGIGSRRKKAFAPLLGSSIFQVDGIPWKSSRDLLRTCFQRGQTAEVHIFEPHVSNFLRAIPHDGSIIDLALLFDRLTADIATDFLFGESVGSLKQPTLLNAGILKAIHDSQAGCEFRWLLGSLSDFIPQRKFFQSVKIVHQYIQKYVDNALQNRTISLPSFGAARISDSLPENVLQKLSSMTQDRKVLQDELLTLYFAGTDATAALLVNLLFMLSKRRDIWQNLRDEVQHLGSEAPNAHQLGGLKRIQNCIYESLRLHPVVPSNSRTAFRDTTLPTGGGSDGSSTLFIPKGTMVHFSIFALHRHRDLWGEDAEEFRPERWLDEKQPWKFVPFLKGPRNCLGQDFAMREVAYVLVRMVQEFKSIESKDDGPWIEQLSMACRSKNGAKVVMIPSGVMQHD